MRRYSLIRRRCRVVKLGLIVVVVCCLSLAIVPAVYAGGSGGGEATGWTKLFNGLHNTLTGWTELPRQVYNVTKEEDLTQGLTYGIIRGIGYGIVRTVSGIMDAALFFVPPYDKPLMEPLECFKGKAS